MRKLTLDLDADKFSLFAYFLAALSGGLATLAFATREDWTVSGKPVELSVVGGAAVFVVGAAVSCVYTAVVFETAGRKPLSKVPNALLMLLASLVGMFVGTSCFWIWRICAFGGAWPSVFFVTGQPGSQRCADSDLCVTGRIPIALLAELSL